MAEKTIPLTEAHLSLLEKRGIDAEMAIRLGWQSCEGRSGDWIAMPFLRAGKVVNHKYRTISGQKKFSQDTGGEQCFYNLAACDEISRLPISEQPNKQIVIVEGEMDCAIALQCGYLAVSVPSGAPDKPVEGEDSKKFKFLEDFPKSTVAVLAVDDDGPGRVLRQEIALRLGWYRCKWAQYPKECKDLNEVFVKYGAKGVRKVLDEKTRFMNQNGLFTMAQLPAMPQLPVYECQIGNVSPMIKLRAGQFIVVTGIPSMGKSLFVNCLAANMARYYGWRVCIASFEDYPRDGIEEYLRMYHMGRKTGTEADIADADAWIEKSFCFITPDLESDDMVNLNWVLAQMKAAITQHGARLLIIDPWNELDHDRPMGMSLTEYTGYAIKELKRLASRYMVTVLVVAHPAKQEKLKDGTYSVPTLYDISDSAHWYNKADIGVIVHRYEGEQDGDYATMIRVQKVRKWGVIGMTGDRFLQYLTDRGTYIDYPDFVIRRPRKDSAKSTPKTAPDEDKQKGLEF